MSPPVDQGFLGYLGISIVWANADSVHLEVIVEDRHLQPFGLVHGGLHCSLIESAASIGAWYAAKKQPVVGVENHTSFLSPAKAGMTLSAKAKPLKVGRRAQLWEVAIEDRAATLIATGRVRLFVV